MTPSGVVVYRSVEAAHRPALSTDQHPISKGIGQMTPIHLPSPAVVIECQRARMTAHTDDWLTIISILGEIDAANVDDLTREARDVVPQRNALILDLAGVEFIGMAGLRTLLAVNVECARCGTSWALIANHAVTRLLRVGDPDGTLPVVGSAVEALLRLRRARRRRRHLSALSD